MFLSDGHIAQIVAQGPPGKPGQQSQFNGTYMQVPTRRDVFMVNANSFTTVRFKTVRYPLFQHVFQCVTWSSICSSQLAPAEYIN
jgi:hypothetical protein